MTIKRFLLYFLVPFIYISVITVFLYFHFNRTALISEKIGSIEVSVVRQRKFLGEESKIGELTVKYGGVRFGFSDSRPLVLLPDGGEEAELSVAGYDIHPDGVELHFTGGTRLGFRTSGDLGNRLDLNIRVGKRSSLLLPVEFADGTVKTGENIPLLTVENSGGNYLVTLPEGSRLDSETGYIRLPYSGSQTVSITRAEEAINSLFLIWFAHKGVLKGREEFEGELAVFLDKAYLGWDTGRYLKGQGMWHLKGEESRFIEKLGSAWMAEALRRGDYRKASAFFSAAQRIYISRNPDFKIHNINSTYIGDLESFREKHSAEELERIRAVESLIRNKDTGVFSVEDLIVLLLNQNKLAYIDDLVSQLVVTVDIGKQSLDVSLGILDTYFDVKRWYSENEPYFARFKEIINTRILPAIRLLGNSVFLESDEANISDIYLSLRAGALLVAAGKEESNEELASLGRSLIVSSLSLADDWGFLPRRLRLDEEVAFIREEYIAPEQIYELLDEWPYLAKERPLYPVLDPGSWIWTAADLIEVRAADNRYHLIFAFPPGETHYLMIRGIEPFSSLELRGVKRGPSPDYAGMPGGWYYDEETRTLYSKLQHHNNNEEVVLDYTFTTP